MAQSGYDAGAPGRSIDAWKRMAAQRLGTDESIGIDADLTAGNASFTRPNASLSHADDAGTQTNFAPRFRETATATIVSTTDLARLIPVPDAATLLQSTLPSLRRAEREAAELLSIIQRDLAFQLQEAGVTYDRSSFDDLRQRSRTFDDAQAGFSERKQLMYKGHRHQAPKSLEDTRSAAPTAAGGASYWNFATHHDDLSVYSEDALRRARALERSAEDARARHKAFEGGNEALIAELEQTRKLLVPTASSADSVLPTRFAGDHHVSGSGTPKP